MIKNQANDVYITVSRDGYKSEDFFLVFYWDRVILENVDNNLINLELDASSKFHRFHAGSA